MMRREDALEAEMRTAWAEFLGLVDPKHKREFLAQLARCHRKPGFSTLIL